MTSRPPCRRGAEFRLPLLIGLFRFAARESVIVNKAMSLIVVASALPLRTDTISVAAVAGQWTVIANLLAGSLLGAWVGAACATRLRSETLYRAIAGSSSCCPRWAIILLISAVKVWRHE